jgi:hypothetical protein
MELKMQRLLLSQLTDLAYYFPHLKEHEIDVKERKEKMK